MSRFHRLPSRCLSSLGTSLATRPSLEVPYKLGQPSHETRRHIIPQPGDLTPGISALEYYNRRLELAKKLPARLAAIVVGNRIQHSSGAVFYPFQQDNDLLYLSGWLEPDSVCVVEKVLDTGTEEDVVFHMVVQPKNPATELWEGERSGLEGATDFFNADEVGSINLVEAYLRSILSRTDVIYWDDKSGAESKWASFLQFSARPVVSLKELVGRKTVKPLKPLLAAQRAVKSPAEIKVMHKAAQISSRAINTAIARVGSDDPFKSEKVLAQYLEYAFVRGGCDEQAYIPVVASGLNALTIHYTRNDDLLYRDETVFVDAGGKLAGYCADISRAWPNSPNGFSDPQKDIYQAVLAANKACIAECGPGVLLQDLHEHSVSILLQGLRSLPGFSNLSRGDVARELFPHYIGHHLGLDLHDVPLVSRHIKLQEGNVVTIEPGLYIPISEKWPKHFRGIGVRVEDDVAVGATASKSTNLTSLCVKEVVDIELVIRLGVTTPGVYDEVVEVEI